MTQTRQFCCCCCRRFQFGNFKGKWWIAVMVAVRTKENHQQQHYLTFNLLLLLTQIFGWWKKEREKSGLRPKWFAIFKTTVALYICKISPNKRKRGGVRDILIHLPASTFEMWYLIYDVAWQNERRVSRLMLIVYLDFLVFCQLNYLGSCISR